MVLRSLVKNIFSVWWSVCVIKIGGIPTSCAETTETFVFRYEDFVAESAVAHRVTLTYPNGIVETIDYDLLGRIQTLAQTHNGTPLASYAYTFYPNGNRHTVMEMNGAMTTWEYDAASRLTRELRKDSAGMAMWDINFTYDPAGNRQTMWDNVTGSTTQYTYTSDGLDQLETVTTDGATRSYSYDAHGNLLKDGIATYSYNARNQLIGRTAAGSTASYVYDVLGNRVRQTVNGVTTNYLWDEFSAYGDVLAELDGSGTVTTQYILSGTTLRAQQREGTTQLPAP